jgi:hypothetical protein
MNKLVKKKDMIDKMIKEKELQLKGLDKTQEMIKISVQEYE